MWRMKGHAIAVGAAMVLLGAQGCSLGETGIDDARSSSMTRGLCEARLHHNDGSYLGLSGLVRDPQVTGRTVAVTLHGCADRGREPGEDVVVKAAVLKGIRPTTALLQGTILYVRDGRQLPPWTERWFTEPVCHHASPFDVVGGRLNSEGGRGSDRDFQPPYRLFLHVDAGPASYVGALLKMRVGTSTKLVPATAHLGAGSSRSHVVARLRCHNGYFEALSLSVRGAS